MNQTEQLVILVTYLHGEDHIDLPDEAPPDGLVAELNLLAVQHHLVPGLALLHGLELLLHGNTLASRAASRAVAAETQVASWERRLRRPEAASGSRGPQRVAGPTAGQLQASRYFQGLRMEIIQLFETDSCCLLREKDHGCTHLGQ